MKRELNKWQCIFSLRTDYAWLDGRKRLVFGVFKLKWFEEEGINFVKSKDSYDGFILDFWLRKPIERVK